MKHGILICMILGLVFELQGQSAIFLHHSTGEGVYVEGNVASWINNYNSSNGTNYTVTERSYPDSPYPWENYPYDYWNLWVNGQCNTTNANIQCLSNILQSYDVVIFKHCFPGAGLVPDNATPTVSSPVKSIANYKLQYRALRGLMDQYPTKKFIIWTLAPLHRLETTTEEAARAREFVNWVKSTWLTEDGKSHPNIYIFDFYNLVAESNPTPVNGKVNCLKYDYEKSHTVIDSHPNLNANQAVGPIFAQFIVNTFKSQATGIKDTFDHAGEVIICPNPGHDQLTIDISRTGENKMSVEMFSINGQMVYSTPMSEETMLNINTNGLTRGTYILRITTGQRTFSRKYAYAGS